MALEMSIRRDGDVTVVTLDGELDIYTVAGFRERLDALGPAAPFVFDLTSVTMLDSSGLGALVGVLNQGSQARVGLVVPDDGVRMLFEVTGLGDAFAFAKDLAGARSQLADVSTPSEGAA